MQKRCHLVDEGPGTAGTYAVHTLVNSAGEIDDLGILTAKLNGNIGLWGIILKGGSHGYDLLGKGHIQVSGQSQSAGAGDARRNGHLAEFFLCP